MFTFFELALSSTQAKNMPHIEIQSSCQSSTRAPSQSIICCAILHFHFYVWCYLMCSGSKMRAFCLFTYIPTRVGRRESFASENSYVSLALVGQAFRDLLWAKTVASLQCVGGCRRRSHHVLHCLNKYFAFNTTLKWSNPFHISHHQFISPSWFNFYLLCLGPPSITQSVQLYPSAVVEKTSNTNFWLPYRRFD